MPKGTWMRSGLLVGLVLALGACGPQVGQLSGQQAELGETRSAIDCPLEKATYTEPQAGWQLRFRPAKSWELVGMTESAMELVRKDGAVLWGEIASNMGTSRDVGRLFFGCERPGRDDEDLSEEQYAACRQWEGVVDSLNGGEPGYMPAQGEMAPERILMTDVGRKLRYSEPVSGPGGEPWDVFDFKSCAE